MFDFSLTSVSHARTPPISAHLQQTHVGPAPGWHTKTHARYISKDRALVAQLEAAVAKGGEAGSSCGAVVRSDLIQNADRNRSKLGTAPAFLESYDSDARPVESLSGIIDSRGG